MTEPSKEAVEAKAKQLYEDAASQTEWPVKPWDEAEAPVISTYRDRAIGFLEAQAQVLAGLGATKPTGIGKILALNSLREWSGQWDRDDAERLLDELFGLCLASVLATLNPNEGEDDGES